MHRRSFLAAGTAAAAVGLINRAAAQAPAAAGDANLTAAYDTVLDRTVQNAPEFASALGYDKGANAGLKRRLDDYGPDALARHVAVTRQNIATIEAVGPTTLSPEAALGREVVLYNLRQQLTGPERFKVGSPQHPYVITQQQGAYGDIPDFLAANHSIETAADCEAYLARLEAFAGALDGDTARQRSEAARGMLAPGFALDLALGQMAKLRAPAPAETTMAQSLASRAKAKGIAGDWQGRAAAIVEKSVYPAVDRQVALVRALRPKARADAGVWALPQGDALYVAALHQATTTELSPETVHTMGLEQVADLSGQLDAILKQQGLTQGTVGARLAQLNTRPEQLYPDTAEGRAALIASLNEGVAKMKPKLPRAFNNPPDNPLEIRAVPVDIQDGASNGYYYRAPLDGSRPAIYWINLKSVGDWPKYSLPSLTYHEGIPGHHLQISTAQGGDQHPLRKIAFFNAYLEGWALYAEQLADELDGYATPVERAGYLQSFLFRAARLVIDTGIHHKRWSHDQATQYMVETVGFAPGRSQREVERYCTQPGQACSYKIGHGAWLAARKRAEQIAGDKFDLKAFHDVLREGALPLTMLDKRVDDRAKAMRA